MLNTHKEMNISLQNGLINCLKLKKGTRLEIKANLIQDCYFTLANGQDADIPIYITQDGKLSFDSSRGEYSFIANIRESTYGSPFDDYYSVYVVSDIAKMRIKANE